jgi:hypothetical protein
LTPTPPASVSLKPGKKKANSVRPTHPAPTSTMPRALLKRPASSCRLAILARTLEDLVRKAAGAAYLNLGHASPLC